MNYREESLLNKYKSFIEANHGKDMLNKLNSEVDKELTDIVLNEKDPNSFNKVRTEIIKSDKDRIEFAVLYE